MVATVSKTSLSRVFFHEGAAGPSVVPAYQGLWRAGAVTWGFGAGTKVEVPSDSEYDRFVTVDTIPGKTENPKLTVTALATLDRSKLLKIARVNCAHDLQVHFGSCRNPQDFNGGWDKVLILEGVRITDYGTGDLGALSSDERKTTDENVTLEGDDLYEIGRISYAEQAAAQVGREVVGIYVCDSAQCASCGRTSDGCQIIFAVAIPAPGSAGLLPIVLYSEDGGSSWNESVITTMAASDIPRAVACVGNYTVVMEPAGNAFHYALSADVLDNDETWTQVTSGIVAGKGPQAIAVVNPTLAWVVGLGGYIYKMADPTSALVASDSAGNTTQNLNAVDAFDANNAVVVGNSNAVVYTATGGETWAAVTGPAVGVNLNAVAMRSATEWWIGTANGKLFYTKNSGVSWSEKGFPGSGAGVVQDIKWASRLVGYLSHSTAAPAGRILRTLDGGYSWYVTPEGTTNIPANDRITSLATCYDPNTVFGGGLADDAADGIIVKGTSAAA